MPAPDKPDRTNALQARLTTQRAAVAQMIEAADQSVRKARAELENSQDAVDTAIDSMRAADDLACAAKSPRAELTACEAKAKARAAYDAARARCRAATLQYRAGCAKYSEALDQSKAVGKLAEQIRSPGGKRPASLGPAIQRRTTPTKPTLTQEIWAGHHKSQTIQGAA